MLRRLNNLESTPKIFTHNVPNKTQKRAHYYLHKRRRSNLQMKKKKQTSIVLMTILLEEGFAEIPFRDSVRANEPTKLAAYRDFVRGRGRTSKASSEGGLRGVKRDRFQSSGCMNSIKR